ncbi:MAG: hypothetical protein WCK58_08670 [Chloroflexota bacterium]
MTRKRKVAYPTTRKTKGPAPVFVPQVTPPTVARINTQAGVGKAEIRVGMPVTILGTGRGAGEVAIVESLTFGVIPAATVRTESGLTRRVRTVDLSPAQRTAPAAPQAPAADPD